MNAALPFMPTIRHQLRPFTRIVDEIEASRALREMEIDVECMGFEWRIEDAVERDLRDFQKEHPDYFRA